MTKSAKDDIEKGQSWCEAVPEDAPANVGGTAAGVGHSAAKTWDDAGHVVSGVGHAAASVWHGIFG